MSENGRELVEQIHREAVERFRQQRQKGRELVEAAFREALDRERQRREQDRALPTQAAEQGGEHLPPHEPLTIPYTELPDTKADSPLYREWNYYRREAGRLLAEGHEGRFVLIKGEEVIGIWDTEEDARAVALQRYLMQPCLIHQVRSREPVLRTPTRFWLTGLSPKRG